MQLGDERAELAYGLCSSSSMEAEAGTEAETVEELLTGFLPMTLLSLLSFKSQNHFHTVGWVLTHQALIKKKI